MLHAGMTVSQWLRQAKGRLEEAGIETPLLEAQMLAAHVLLSDRSFVLSHPHEDFPDLAGESILQRRESHEPLAYILGWREFYGRRFSVDPAVLIPRQETETLVETALALLVERGQASRVLDLGTGSGCIAITLKLEYPECQVVCSDVSEAALEVAACNAQRLGAEVETVAGDLFAGLTGQLFDLIVSNPPYVGLHEALPVEVREFEPSSALYGGHSGLEFYERIAAAAGEFLGDNGVLMMEVGHTQARAVALLFEGSGWTVAETVRDLSGNDRVVVVEPVFA
jgi:release factor glutamine methyltransferase